MSKIPVTVITGFLGSGKTTTIRHLLQNNQGRRIAVLVNEFGEIGIDGELLRSCQVCDDSNDDINSNIVELTNGCLCCTVQEEFLPTMQELLKRRDRLDCILIETSGLALPKPLIQAFRWPEITTGATVDGVVTIVDCEALASGNLVSDILAFNEQKKADDMRSRAYRSLEHETPIEELFEDQLACADLVLLTKTDLVDVETKNKVVAWLKQELPTGVKIITCQDGQINPDILLGFKAAVEDNLASRPSHHDTEEEHEHDEEINSVHLEIDRTFTPDDLISQLKEIVKQEEIYRIKGFVAVPNKPMRLVIQGVGERLEYFYDRPWQINENRVTKLVFIGKNLQLQPIQQKLK